MRELPRWERQPGPEQARRAFFGLWLLVGAVKLALATRLPLFVDEAYYWQEGQHLAWAYSDLPGLTAWLARLGVALGGAQPLALRAPFLLIGALIPWLLARLAVREFGPQHGWHAGSLALLLPLAGALGLLALPDVPMTLAALLCLDAGARLLRRVDPLAAAELALGLVLGALSHYRFVALIGVGLLALLLLPQGRRALRQPLVWAALALGALAWWPLLHWNLANAEAGLRFQLLDRHPWAFHVDGARFVLVQALLATPLLGWAMLRAGWRGLRDTHAATRYCAWLGGLLVLAWFVLGFFADSERVSFHWPLQGYLALLPLAALGIAGWPRRWRIATWALAGFGLAAVFAYYALAATPALRTRVAAEKFHPVNFTGWHELAEAVRMQRAAMPADTRLVAGSFKIGAELGFLLREPDIAVLDHPLNHQHGRAPQLRLWGLTADRRAAWGEAPVLLAVAPGEVEFKDLLSYYHALCAQVGPLPAPRVLNIDHGRQRFLLFALPARPAAGTCTTPALAWIDTPVAGAPVGRTFAVEGWAFKDGTGLARVEVTLDGRVVASAVYGHDFPGLQASWDGSTDPNHPRVGFRAAVDLRAAPALAPGRHWLGLRLHGRDGSVETWPEQPLLLGD
jgi:4-amino-4-deoxy-L-arabinose transferase-like glycosyltransferase